MVSLAMPPPPLSSLHLFSNATCLTWFFPTLHASQKGSPLLVAVEMGLNKVVELFLSDPAIRPRLDVRFPDGQGAVLSAVNRGNLQLLNILLKHGIDPAHHITTRYLLSQPGYQGDRSRTRGAITVWHSAVSIPEPALAVPILQRLVQSGVHDIVKPQTLSPGGFSPLHYLFLQPIHNDSIDLLQELLHVPGIASIVNKPTPNGWTPLQLLVCADLHRASRRAVEHHGRLAYVIEDDFEEELVVTDMAQLLMQYGANPVALG